MAGQPAAGRVSTERYLSDPACERLEWVDGELLERHVGGKKHAKIQVRLGRKLDEYLESNPRGWAAAELRVKLTSGSRAEFRLPDLAVVLGDTSPEEDYLDRAPDLVIEIRSPDDSIAELLEKMNLYLANGARLGWLVLPEEASVLVVSPGQVVRALRRGDVLEGGELLPGLSIPLAELFAGL
jgi:Uma2 family endonuclease